MSSVASFVDKRVGVGNLSMCSQIYGKTYTYPIERKPDIVCVYEKKMLNCFDRTLHGFPFYRFSPLV